jgi:hypothetical protein
MSHIGSLNEKPLHAVLKQWYAKDGDQLEVAVDKYFIDIVRDNELFEIQTGNFASIRPKLKRLLAQGFGVRLIFPIAQEKWIVKLPHENLPNSAKRKSPKRGRVEDIFEEIIRIPHLIKHPNFSIEILMTKQEEVREFHEKKYWRKNGWKTVEHRLIEVVDTHILTTLDDWKKLVPTELETFTVNDLCERLKIKKKLSQKMAYSLSRMGASDLIGKKGRANLYRIKNEPLTIGS